MRTSHSTETTIQTDAHKHQLSLSQLAIHFSLTLTPVSCDLELQPIPVSFKGSHMTQKLVMDIKLRKLLSLLLTMVKEQVNGSFHGM